VSGCEQIANLDDARDEWTRLARQTSSPFATWEWASAWWRHFAPGELRLLRCKRDGEPFAIAPLYAARRGPLRVLRFLGHGAGDVLGPVCAPADRGAAGEALVEALRAGAAGPWDVLLAERLPRGPLGAALGGVALASEACPELDTEGRGWEEFLASRSRNMREKLRRNTRKLERAHSLEFRLCEDAGRLEADLETLFALHSLRWGEETEFAAPASVAFHRELAATALERGWLRLWTMEVDGEPAAAWYGFRLGGVESFYQSGRDPRFDRFSVGFLMLMRTIQATFEDGLERYSFLRGDEAYKNRFVDPAADSGGLETRALGRGPLGRASVRLGAVAMRSPRLRRGLRSAGGP
jgi:CelD/BcsL family acetyltransferase involved in cellulose biosynthesis